MVESYANVDGQPSILRIETTTEGQKFAIPPFLQVLREVTDDPFYETGNMADINYKMPLKDKELINERVQQMQQKEKQTSKSADNGNGKKKNWTIWLDAWSYLNYFMVGLLHQIFNKEAQNRKNDNWSNATSKVQSRDSNHSHL